MQWRVFLAGRVQGATSRAVGTAAWKRLRSHAWPGAQAVLAVVASWLLAHDVAGHREPFFAPIATLVALGATSGGRGRHALDLLVGVGIGVAAGSVATAAFGGGARALGLAAALALAVGLLASPSMTATVQAGSSAILVVAVHRTGSNAGLERLLDALIGSGVALLVSQLLFPADPVRLMREASREVCRELARTYDVLVRVLQGDPDADGLEQVRRLEEALATARRAESLARSAAGPLSRRRTVGERLGRERRWLDGLAAAAHGSAGVIAIAARLPFGSGAERSCVAEPASTLAKSAAELAGGGTGEAARLARRAEREARGAAAHVGERTRALADTLASVAGDLACLQGDPPVASGDGRFCFHDLGIRALGESGRERQ